MYKPGFYQIANGQKDDDLKSGFTRLLSALLSKVSLTEVKSVYTENQHPLKDYAYLKVLILYIENQLKNPEVDVELIAEILLEVSVLGNRCFPDPSGPEILCFRQCGFDAIQEREIYRLAFEQLSYQITSSLEVDSENDAELSSDNTA